MSASLFLSLSLPLFLSLSLSLSLGLTLTLSLPSDLLAAPPSTLIGRYTCALESSGTRYPAMPCAITARRAKDGSGRTLWFRKATGSQRIEGWVAAKEDGFEVDGRFWCPKGDCAQPVQVRFVAEPGGFRGTLEHDQAGPMTIAMRKK
ncbi:MAG: hypothetical protein FJ100_10800 [Deltaproteobacteria bacterium]|nr:hypothetical protein [Deltaproteobacteria bacterium]